MIFVRFSVDLQLILMIFFASIFVHATTCHVTKMSLKKCVAEKFLSMACSKLKLITSLHENMINFI